MGNCTDCMLIIKPQLIKSCIIQVDCTAKHNNKGAATLRIGTGDRKLGSDFTLQTAESPGMLMECTSCKGQYLIYLCPKEG